MKEASLADLKEYLKADQKVLMKADLPSKVRLMVSVIKSKNDC